MKRLFVVLIAGSFLITAACAPQPPQLGSQEAAPTVVRLGYFPNITHAQAVIGVERGLFAERLGPDTKLETKLFNAGPSVIEAIFANELDISYIGPNPAINGYTRSQGKALRVVAGSVSGGAQFVVRADAGIIKASDLAGKRIATPQLGNTQDVALRAYLQANGLNSKERGGNVEVLPVANPDIFLLFQTGDIHGAWVPEPWATRLVLDAGGKVFLDERTLWPNGDFVTTQVIVRREFLHQYPSTVKKILEAHLDATVWANKNLAEARSVVNDGIKKATSAALPKEVIDTAWGNMRLTYDPFSASLFKSASDAFKLGFLGAREPDLRGIYDLTLLNDLLKQRGLEQVQH